MAQPVIEQIETFLQRYPDEEFGCGHNVLSDHNLLDSDIEFCIRRGREFLAGNLPEMDYHPEHTRKAIEFLEHLLTIPEDDRVPDDWYQDEE